MYSDGLLNLTATRKLAYTSLVRYLFGDLTEFPAGENTLDLLRRMIDMSVDTLMLDHHIGDSLDAIEADRQFLANALLGVDDFHQQLQCFIADRTSRLERDDPVAVIAEGISERVRAIVDDSKTRLVRRVEERIQSSQQEILATGRRMFERLGHFFSPNPLPIRSNRLRCAFDGTRFIASTEITDVTGVCCRYTVDASAIDLFSAPRRGAEIFDGKFDLPVGLKKAWLKKEPAVEFMRLDDTFLLEVNDDDGVCQLRLSKKTAQSAEGVLLQLSANGQQFSVSRLDANGAAQPVDPALIGPEHSSRIVTLWEKIRPSILSLYRTPGSISLLTIDGQDIIEARLAPELARRLVAFLAPTVREIGTRSSSPGELCLKIEHSEGRREEIYVSKQELSARISQLAPNQRAIFTPLGLDPTMEEVSGGEVDDGPTQPS